MPRYIALRRLVAVALSTASAALAATARADSTPALNSLTTPDSPAFTVIGVSPTTVQRPTTPNALSLAIVNAFTSTGTTLAPNYAIEVAPYWVVPRTFDTFDAVSRSFSNPLERLTISFATTPSSAETSLSKSMSAGATVAPPVPKASLGVRTALLQGEPNAKAIEQCRQRLQAQADFVGTYTATQIAAWQESWKKAWRAQHDGAEPPPDLVPAPTSEMIAVWGKEALGDSKAPNVDTKGCVKAVAAKEGLVVDVAAAAAMSFPDYQVDRGTLATYSAWTTISYLLTNFSGLVLARFMQDNLNVSGNHTTSLDLGGRAIATFDDFGVSGEGVYRVPLDSNTANDQYRVDLSVDWKVFNYWLSVTGGHDFVDGSDWSKFFAIANFKATIGDGPTVKQP